MINLPWPPRQLSPNARVHWKMKSAFAKRYRNTCKVICLSEKLTAPKAEGKLHLWITFFPPDKPDIPHPHLDQYFGQFTRR